MAKPNYEKNEQLLGNAKYLKSKKEKKKETNRPYRHDITFNLTSQQNLQIVFKRMKYRMASNNSAQGQTPQK